MHIDDLPILLQNKAEVFVGPYDREIELFVDELVDNTGAELCDLAQYIDDNYMGEFDNDIQFAQEMCPDWDSIPDWLESYIDWDAVADDLLKYDYFKIDYHYFRNC